MVSWWKLEGNALDARGNNNGTLVAAPTLGTGKVGQAFSFNGSTQYVNVPDNLSNSITGALSIDAWIDPSSVSAAQTIVSKYDFGSNQVSYFFGMQPGGALQFVVYNDAAGVVFRGVQTTSTVPTGAFTHVAATFDPSNGNMKIYVNGVDSGAPFIANSSVIPSIADTTAALRIGAVVDQSGSILPFNGVLDEVELFNRALTPTEVAGIYNASTAGKCTLTGANGPVAWWAADGDFRDITANGFDGTAEGTTNGPTGFAKGEVGQAFNFDGVDDDVTFPVPASVTGGAARTVDFWYWVAPGQAITNHQLFFYGNTGVTHQSWGVDFASPPTSGSGTVRLSLFTWADDLDVDTGVQPGNWAHFVGTYDGGTTIRAYINGSLVGTKTLSGPLLTPGGTGRIGHLNSFFGGMMDEISLYDRALSDAEVASIYNAGSAGKYKSVAVTGNASFNAGGDATVTFTGVTSPGILQQVPIDGTLYPPTLPGGQTPLGLYYDVSTNAVYGQAKVCFHLPLVTTSAAFNNLRIDHFNGTSWDDVTNTLLVPGGIDFTNRNICTDTTKLTTLSPFAIGSVAAATAAGVTISGHVLAPGGGGLRNASVVITGFDGTTRRATTNAFGYYTFEDVRSGGSYIMGVESRRFTYATRVITVTDSLANIDFTPIE